jgi:hypothetical protein
LFLLLSVLSCHAAYGVVLSAVATHLSQVSQGGQSHTRSCAT